MASHSLATKGVSSADFAAYDAAAMIETSPTSPATKDAFIAIAAAMASEGVASSTMFGMPSLKTGGKAFLGVFGDALVFKLTGGEHAGALKLHGVTLFDPSGMGRPMKEWVVVPSAHRKRWSALADAAFAYVGAKPAGAAKGAAKKKPSPKKPAANAPKAKAGAKPKVPRARARSQA